jgi:hypothetical protein
VGCGRGRRTPSNARASSRCRGMTVTSSISHRNAISGGVSPGGRGSAIAATRQVVVASATCCLIFGRSRMWTSPNKLLLPAGLSQPLPLSCTCSIIPVIFVRFLGRKMPPLLQTWTQAVAPVLLVGAAGVWYNVVSRDVPEPYLVRLSNVIRAMLTSPGRIFPRTTSSEILSR